MTEIHIILSPDWKESQSLLGLLESLKLKGFIEYNIIPTTPSEFIQQIAEQASKGFDELIKGLQEMGIVSKTPTVTHVEKPK